MPSRRGHEEREAIVEAIQKIDRRLEIVEKTIKWILWPLRVVIAGLTIAAGAMVMELVKWLWGRVVP